MRVLYPENPLDSSQADDPYQEEFLAVRAAGYGCSLFDFDGLVLREFKPHPKLQSDEPVMYRGWMLNPQGYGQLIQQIERKGGKPITSVDDYLRCHHLPGWYGQCIHFTAETYFFEANDSLQSELENLGWDRYFVKDFVKSNTADKGSIANSPLEVCTIVEQIATYRGEIEGGVAIRRVEEYRAGTEQRYFVVRGVPYGLDGKVPQLVQDIANTIDAPFYSVDVIENEVGDHRLVELGDGQVSDKKAWPIERFVEVIVANACEP